MSRCDDQCDNVISVTVFVPTCPDPSPFTWNEAKRVGEAADDVARTFEIKAEEPTFQNHRDKVLDRNHTLQEAGVKERDKLEFVSVGGGV